MIEFHCPYCTAAIRVADSAAGKRGTCPSCAQKVLVPRPGEAIGGVPSAAAQSKAKPADTSAPDEADPPAAPQWFAPIGRPVGKPAEPRRAVPGGASLPPAPDAAEDSESEMPAFPVADEPDVPQVPLIVTGGPAPQTSIARRLKRRSRRKRAVPWIPIACMLVLLLAIGVFTFLSQHGLGGELRADPLPDFKVAPVVVEPEPEDLPADRLALVLDGLQQFPKTLRSDYVWTEFQGTSRGIRVLLAEGDATLFYKVHTANHPAIRKFLAENSGLDQARETELQQAAAEFVLEWDQAGNIAEAIRDLPHYRDRLGINAMVGGLGYHVAAVHDNREYRCVYEDADGNLYFLLPEGVREFHLQGRRLEDGSRPFPGKFHVTVVGDARRKRDTMIPTRE